jgi:hypothetical protein
LCRNFFPSLLRRKSLVARRDHEKPDRPVFLPLRGIPAH